MSDLSWIEQRYLFALISFILCGAIAWGCLCRLTKMSSTTASRPARAVYSASMTAAIAVATQPWWLGELPGWAEIILASALLAHLWIGRKAWVNGPPPHVKPRPKWPPIDGGSTP